MQPFIQSSLPHPWEQERTFDDALYEWMTRAPWLALSAAAHAIVLVVLLAIPWDLLREEEPVVVMSAIEHVPDTVFEEPIVEPPPPIETPIPPVDPQLVQSNDPPSDVPTPNGHQGDDALDLLSPVDVKTDALSEIGLGGGWGPKYASRWTGDGGVPSGGGSGTEIIIARGLAWLAAHQAPDGSWDADGFSEQCGKIGARTCGDPGDQAHDVGMTGLALLAFLGCGNTTRRGAHADVVRRGVKWLRDAQDPDTGLIGQPLGHSYVYDHAIAALALCEAYAMSGSPILRGSAQASVHWITRARNPYSAWRYSSPPTGENDTSVTGWMVFALKAADDAGLDVDLAAYDGALSWLDEVTDPSSGRCGYTRVGSPSSRVPRVNDHYPTDRAEGMTAVALLSRFLLGQRPEDTPVMERHADLLLRKLPEWDDDGLGNDMYYWYYGSYAMYQMGGARHWRPWERAMRGSIGRAQREDGDLLGSWDPSGPWGAIGGRVYSTAMMTLCMEVYFRYAQITGAR